MNRRIRLAAAFVLAVLAVAPAGGPLRAEGGTASAPGRWSGPAFGPMRLGFPVDRWQAESAAAQPLVRAERCRRWRATANSLGETFAGHTLRKTVVHRHCKFIEDSDRAGAWEWPWSGLEHGSVLLPRLYKSFGAWAVHCARGRGGRCVLVHALDRPESAHRHDPLVGAATHFVIDRVGGREMLLWRLYLPLPVASGTAIAGVGGAVVTGRATADAFRSASEVRYRIGRTLHRERFPVCTRAGCLMEAQGKASGAVATALSAGTPVSIEIAEPSGTAGPVVLPPQGFHAALAELIRLRRLERRGRTP